MKSVSNSWSAVFGKLRPTAIVFGGLMVWIALVLIKAVLLGPVGQAAFGEGQAGAVVASALLIVGAVIGGLAAATVKLSEDAPEPPAAQVPAESHMELIRILAIAVEKPSESQLLISEQVDGHRANEGISDS